MKKLLALIMSVAMVLSFTAVMPSYAEDGSGGWIYSGDGKRITAYNGNGGKVVIPDGSVVGASVEFLAQGLLTAGGECVPVTELVVGRDVKFEGSPFQGCTSFKRIEFNNTSENDEILYFTGSSLEYLKLPDGVKDIPDDMCRRCESLKTVIMPESVKSIGSGAFAECEELNDINMPDGIEEIGEDAFYRCESLKEINLSAIKSIGKNAFYFCGGVETVTMPDGVDFTEIPLHSVVNFNYNGKLTWQLAEAMSNSPWIKKNYYDKNDMFIIDGHFLKYSGSGKNPEISSGVKYISPGAFRDCAVEGVVLPDGLLEIGNYAFMNNVNLKSVTIPASVKSIGEFAFEDCTSLSSLRVEGAALIGGGAFSNTLLAWENIHLADGVQYSGATENTEYPSDPLIFLYPWYNEDTEVWYVSDGKWVFGKAGEQPSATPGPGVTASPSATADPKATPNPNATPDPKATTAPQVTPDPKATPAPHVLTVSETDGKITVSVNGAPVVFTDAEPFIDDHDRTQIPVRAVTEALGAAVDWNEETEIVTVSAGDADITLKIGSDVMNVNGEERKMDTAAVIIGDRTYIPLRFAAEALGMTINYAD